jgi:hypothetical protein
MVLFFLVVLGFGLRALHLLGRCSTTSAMPPALYCFSYFLERVLHFLSKAGLGDNPPTMLLDFRCGPSHLACWLNGGLGNFLPGAGLEP